MTTIDEERNVIQLIIIRIVVEIIVVACHVTTKKSTQLGTEVAAAAARLGTRTVAAIGFIAVAALVLRRRHHLRRQPWIRRRGDSMAKEKTHTDDPTRGHVHFRHEVCFYLIDET